MVVVVAEAAVGVQAEAMVEEQVPFSPEVPQGHRLALHLVAGLVLQFHKVKFSVAERREVGLGAIYMETGHILSQLTSDSKFTMSNQSIWKWVSWLSRSWCC